MTYDNDVEDRGTSGSRTPLLGSSSHQRIGQESEGYRWSLMTVLQFFGGGIYAPDPTTYDPLEIILNTEDQDERDDLTVRWRDNKLSELNFVGVVVSIRKDFPIWSYVRNHARQIPPASCRMRVPLRRAQSCILFFS
jgi:hypothetical protein